jgi:hypothetical protein
MAGQALSKRQFSMDQARQEAEDAYLLDPGGTWLR